MFEKADEYLLKIFMHESSDNNFDLFAQKGENFSLGGILPETEEAYALYKRNNRIGLKIDNGKYIFIQTRTKFIDSDEFENLLENDEEQDEEKLRAEFKDVDYVTFWETDAENGTRLKIAYLANKSSYIVKDYYKIFDNFENISVSFKDHLLNSNTLTKLKLSEPYDPSFDATQKDMARKKIVCIVSETLHNNYYIKQNLEEMTNLFLRQSIMRKVTNESVESDIKSYMLSSDIFDCIENVKKALESKFGNDALGER